MKAIIHELLGRHVTLENSGQKVSGTLKAVDSEGDGLRSVILEKNGQWIIVRGWEAIKVEDCGMSVMRKALSD
jgi:hypothetical protein